MRKILLFITFSLFGISVYSQTKRVECVEVYERNKTTPNDILSYEYDSQGRLIRIYDEEKYRTHQEEILFSYNDANGTITIEGFGDGVHNKDIIGKSVLTINNGRVTKLYYQNLWDEIEYDFAYNNEGEWIEVSINGQTVGNNIWEDGNIVNMEGEYWAFGETTSFTDYNYPESFPIFYTPSMEYSAIDMPSPFFHFCSLFGKRQKKLPASAIYDEDSMMTYSYKLDSEGNIVEIVEQEEYLHSHHVTEYRIVFHYGEATVTGINLLKHNSVTQNNIRFNLSGQKLSKYVKGLTIIKDSKGNVRKYINLK